MMSDGGRQRVRGRDKSLLALNVVQRLLKALIAVAFLVYIALPTEPGDSFEVIIALTFVMLVALLFIDALFLRFSYGQPLAKTFGTVKYDGGWLDEWLKRFPRVHRIVPPLALTLLVALFLITLGYLLFGQSA
jgi:hypothetical protein